MGLLNMTDSNACLLQKSKCQLPERTWGRAFQSHTGCTGCAPGFMFMQVNEQQAPGLRACSRHCDRNRYGWQYQVLIVVMTLTVLA